MVAVTEGRRKIQVALGPRGIDSRPVPTGGRDEVPDARTGGQAEQPGIRHRPDDLDHDLGARAIRRDRRGGHTGLE